MSLTGMIHVPLFFPEIFLSPKIPQILSFLAIDHSALPRTNHSDTSSHSLNKYMHVLCTCVMCYVYGVNVQICIVCACVCVCCVCVCSECVQVCIHSINNNREESETFMYLHMDGVSFRTDCQSDLGIQRDGKRLDKCN